MGIDTIVLDGSGANGWDYLSAQRQKNQIPEAFGLAEFDPRIGVKRDVGNTGGSSSGKVSAQQLNI